jgi:hypothetical protein
MANIAYQIHPGLTVTSITSYDGGRLGMGAQSDGTPEDGAMPPPMAIPAFTSTGNSASSPKKPASIIPPAS